MFQLGGIAIYAKTLALFIPVFLFENVEGNCYDQDKDYVGLPVRNIKDFHKMQIYSAKDCQLLCQGDDDCQFWVWNSPGSQGNKNTCWLKSNNEKSEYRPGKVSGPKDCSGLQETTMPSFDTTTPGEEETTSGIEDGNNGGNIDCSAFYLNNTAVGRGRGNGIPRPNGRVNNIQSAEACRQECVKNPDCKFFIWNSPSSRKARQRLSCWLKKNNKNKDQSNKQFGRISGPVTCDVEEGQNLDADIESQDGTIDLIDFSK